MTILATLKYLLVRVWWLIAMTGGGVLALAVGALLSTAMMSLAGV